MILRSALRAGRGLRRVPPVQLVVEHGEPHRAPHWCGTDTRDVEESSAVLNWWGVTPIGHGYQLRAYSAAPASVRGVRPLDRSDALAMEDEEVKRMKKMRVFLTAQRTFMEYLHVTRGLSFSDAEHISKHSPVFVSKLLNQVKDAIKDPVPTEGGEAVFRSKVKTREMRDERATTALQRLFRYHPINEFEPFFESMGLKPSEYESFLPQDLMFLSDDETLLENYRVLCNYGVMRTKIGGIYRDAVEVFRFGDGVLASKLRAIEDLGFSKTTVIKLVTCCPAVLTRDPHAELKIIKWLDDIGIQRDWIGQFISIRKSYNWRKMVEVPQFFTELGFDKEAIGKLIRKHPDFLLDGSGMVLFRAVAIMLKAGSGKEDLFNLFMDFPDVQARSFARNIHCVILFLTDIKVSKEDIKKFVVANASMLGSSRVKKANSIRTCLNVGKKRLRNIIMEEPSELMKYGLGLKVSRLPPCDRNRTEKSLKEKVKFLKNIGFEEGSDDMNKTLKALRGKGDELQDRFDFLVKTGFEPKDVSHMIKVAPHVLNQKIHVLESKISFLLNETSYPLRALVGYPSFLSFTIERTKTRFLMYNWLQGKGLAPNFAMSTLLACSEKRFFNSLVLKHEKGPEVWEKLKKEVAADKNVHCTSDD